MSGVVTLSRETVAGFIQRHRNGVFTNDVAARFGMYVPDARRHLKKMERDGLIISERDTASGAFVGAGLVWRWRSRPRD